jgi:hypothetical protein
VSETAQHAALIWCLVGQQAGAQPTAWMCTHAQQIEPTTCNTARGCEMTSNHLMLNSSQMGFGGADGDTGRVHVSWSEHSACQVFKNGNVGAAKQGILKRWIMCQAPCIQRLSQPTPQPHCMRAQQRLLLSPAGGLSCPASPPVSIGCCCTASRLVWVRPASSARETVSRVIVSKQQSHPL